LVCNFVKGFWKEPFYETTFGGQKNKKRPLEKAVVYEIMNSFLNL